MSYFSDGYESIKLPLTGKEKLRRAQLGAIHAIASYFSLPQTQPGIVVMPTGSGKTAVIAIAGFLLRANRIMVLTPSQLVRTQINDEIASLSVLKRSGVLPADFVGPKVIEVKSRLSDEAAWESLKEAQCVVSTPQCVSPGIDGVSAPPGGLFDLIIMDEAHHSEAPRWADILQHFQKTQRLLFTATPFRRDKKELKGNLIYNYPLRLAYEDKIFGKLTFLPVTPGAGEDHDVCLAKEAAKAYKKDIDAGFPHRLMVRTDSKTRADKLAEIYKFETTLTLEVVHSGHSMKRIKATLGKLKNGDIDGIICVAMMGEGFDFPQLKIAAIHAPHKSLAVTLQFIGRFARTGDAELGSAKFLAVPQDIQAETAELYRESAAWQDIVSNLSAARIEKEVEVKKMAESFAPVEIAEEEIADVMMADFRPYFHVKIYQVDNIPNFNKAPDLASDIKIIRREVSEEYSSTILLIRQKTRPRWTDQERFSRIEYDLIVLYYDEDSKLLFINSSRRTLEFYQIFEDWCGEGTATLVPGPRINRVLAEVNNPNFFSVGLKNSVQSTNMESYQTRAGASAETSITPTDGLLWQRGHVFGKGVDNQGLSLTIGYSSSSKVWSNTSARIGELVSWCRNLSRKLMSTGTVKTGTKLDTLEIGDEVNELPDGVIGVGWPGHAFKHFPLIIINQGSEKIESQLLDLEITLDSKATTNDEWIVSISHATPELNAKISFTIENARWSFKWAGEEPNFAVILRDSEVSLMTYLRYHPFAFFLNDFSRLEGSTVFYNRNATGKNISADSLVHLDWVGQNIDIEIEFPAAGINFDDPKTVQELVGKTLREKHNGIVFYDHGTGEMADFVVLEPTDETVKVCLYHCKGSGGPAPGDRVADAYEVCGQVVKCLMWLKNRQSVRSRLLSREETTDGKSHYLKGTRGQMLDLLADTSSKRLEVEIYLVQPGISTSNVSEKIGYILGAASDYVTRASGAKMILLGSP